MLKPLPRCKSRCYFHSHQQLKRRFLALPAEFITWAYQVIKQVGGYHEIFRRDLGEDSALRLDRGLNALWNAPAPGLMYAPPMR